MMGRQTIAKIFSSRIFYIVFAILASVALWLYVEINDPQEGAVTLNVPVTFRNEQTLYDRGLVNTSAPGTVEVTFTGPRSIVARLNAGTVFAEVDLIGVALPGHNMTMGFSVNYNLPATVNASLLTYIRSTNHVHVTVERLAAKTVIVDGVYVGGTASPEYVAGVPEFNPQMISVFGPESVIAQIDVAWVEILRENLYETYTNDLPFTLLDAYGVALSQELLEQIRISQDTVRVTVPITMFRDVRLAVSKTLGAGANENNTTFRFSPEYVTISGPPAVLREIDSIIVGTFDLTNMELSWSQTYPITMPYEDLVNVSGETEAIVSASIQGLEVRTFSVDNIHAINEPDEPLEIVTRRLDVRIRGSREDLDALAQMNETQLNIRVTANLAGAVPGSVPATVWIDGEVGDVGAIGNYSVMVRRPVENENP